jgi:hypothetical protein
MGLNICIETRRFTVALGGAESFRETYSSSASQEVPAFHGTATAVFRTAKLSTASRPSLSQQIRSATPSGGYAKAS